MSQKVISALDGFIQKYVFVASAQGMLIEYDPAWPSACTSKKNDEGELVEWKPVLREDNVDFSGMETALDMIIHPDLKVFYSRYWSDNLDANTDKGSLQLLQAWNPEDFERLQQNLVGHIMMKRRLKQTDTLFFGITDEDDFIVTLDNLSGKVMLEQVGIHPTEVLAASLAEFLDMLSPNNS